MRFILFIVGFLQVINSGTAVFVPVSQSKVIPYIKNDPITEVYIDSILTTVIEPPFRLVPNNCSIDNGTLDLNMPSCLWWPADRLDPILLTFFEVEQYLDCESEDEEQMQIPISPFQYKQLKKYVYFRFVSSCSPKLITGNIRFLFKKVFEDKSFEENMVYFTSPTIGISMYQLVYEFIREGGDANVIYMLQAPNKSVQKTVAFIPQPYAIYGNVIYTPGQEYVDYIVDQYVDTKLWDDFIYIDGRLLSHSIGYCHKIRIFNPIKGFLDITRLEKNDTIHIRLSVEKMNVYPLCMMQYLNKPLCYDWAECEHDPPRSYKCILKSSNTSGGYIKRACNYPSLLNAVCPVMEDTLPDNTQLKNMTVQTKSNMLKTMINDTAKFHDASDLTHALQIMDMMDDEKMLDSMDRSELKTVMNDMLNCVETLMSNDIPWNDVSPMSRGKGATDMTMALEGPALAMARKMAGSKDLNSTKWYKFNKPKVDLEIVPINAQDMSASFTSDENSISVSLTNKSQERVFVVFAQYSGLAETLHIPGNFNVISNIISASLSSRATQGVKVTFRLHHKPINSSGPDLNDQRSCAYWNQSDDGEGWLWATDGCEVLSSSTSLYTVCECSHLTNFGILFNFHGKVQFQTTLPKEHLVSIAVLTYLSCIIAILFLGMFLFYTTFVGVFCLDQFNLGLCLLLGNLVFLVGINRTENAIACAVIAGLLHFLFLAAFSWKLIFGLNALRLILSTSYIIDIMVKWRKRLIFVGYAIPLLITGITAGIRYYDFGSKDFCWLSADHGTIWAFLGPVLVILGINSVALVIIAFVLIRNFIATKNTRIHQKNHSKVLAQLTLTMGVTWISGYFTYNKSSALVFTYIFIISNALQGFLLFFIVIGINKDNRNLFIRYLSQKFSSLAESSSDKSAHFNRRKSDNQSTQPLYRTKQEKKMDSDAESSEPSLQHRKRWVFRRQTKSTTLSSSSNQDSNTPSFSADLYGPVTPGNQNGHELVPFLTPTITRVNRDVGQIEEDEENDDAFVNPTTDPEVAIINSSTRRETNADKTEMSEEENSTK